MSNRYFVVIFELPKQKKLGDLATPDHAKPVEFRGSARSNACSAEHRNALAHGPQNFLVPDRGNIFEIAVDNPDGSGPFRRDPINITLGGRRQKSRIELLGGFVCSDGRTHKHIHTHAAASKMARARRPKE